MLRVTFVKHAGESAVHELENVDSRHVAELFASGYRNALALAKEDGRDDALLWINAADGNAGYMIPLNLTEIKEIRWENIP